MIRPVVTVDREALACYLATSTGRVGSTGTEEEQTRRAAEEVLHQSLRDAPAPGQDLNLDGSAILLDSFGAVLARTENTDRVVAVVDMEGAVAGTDGAQRDRRRFLAPVPMLAELVVRLLACGREDVSREAFLQALARQEEGADAPG